MIRINSDCFKIFYFIFALCNLYGIIFLSSLKMQSLPRLQLLRLARVQRVTCLNWDLNWRKLRGLGKRLRTGVQELPRTVLSCRLRSVHVMDLFRFTMTLSEFTFYLHKDNFTCLMKWILWTSSFWEHDEMLNAVEPIAVTYVSII